MRGILPYQYQAKVIQSGSLIQVYEYEKPITTNRITLRDDYRKRKTGTKLDRNLNRTRNNLIRLIECNRGTSPKFITLTIADPNTTGSDLDHYLKQFAKRYQRHYKSPIKSITIIEQSQERAKTYGQAPPHAHVYLDHDEYIPPKLLDKLWPYGFYKINAIDDPKNIGRYVAKYLTKEKLALNKKGFRTSRSLNRPKVFTLPQANMWTNADFANVYAFNFLEHFNVCNFFEYHDITTAPQFVNFETGEVVTIQHVIDESDHLRKGQVSPYLTIAHMKKIDEKLKYEAELLKKEINHGIPTKNDHSEELRARKHRSTLEVNL